MDMLPPQAPPALVSSVDQPALDALDRLGDSQAWICRQQDDLPDPALPGLTADDLRDELDAFWHTAIAHAPGDAPIPRRMALARQLRRIARDDAQLRAAGGLLPAGAADLVMRATASADGVTPTDVHAGELHVDGFPLGGTLVLWSDRPDDGILVFGTRVGWERFLSLDDLVADVETRFGGESGDGRVVVRPVVGDIVERAAARIVDDLGEAVADAWNATVARPVDRIDRLHATFDLHAWIDPYAIAAVYLTDSSAGGDGMGRVPRSPPTLAGGAARAAGKAGRRTATVGASVARVLPGQVTRRVGTRLPVVAAPARTGGLVRPETLLPRRFMARDVAAPAGPEPVDGVLAIGNARFIRQGNDLYNVRFDASMNAWRLNRPDALDPRYAGPLVERLPDGRWQLKREAGLPGGSGRGVRAEPSRARGAEVDALSEAQVRVLQGYLTDRIGLEQGIALYRRMLHTPLVGEAPAPIAASELALWSEATAHARAYVPPATVPQALAPLSVEGMTTDQLRYVQAILLQRMDFNAGAAFFHQMTHPQVAVPGPAINADRVRIWNEVVREVRAGGKPRGRAVTPLAKRAKASALRDFSHRELDELRRLLIEELGPQGREVYQQMAYRITADAPVPRPMQRHTALWDELIRTVLAHREHPVGLGRLQSPDISDYVLGERRIVRRWLNRTLGDEQGRAVYNAMSRRPTLATPSSVTNYQAAVWRDALAFARNLPTDNAPRLTMPAGYRLVPESEWPEAVYYYTSLENLEALGDSALVMAQARLNGDVVAIPLFATEPDAIPGLLDPISRQWLTPREGTTYASLGDVTGAWARIDLRAALADINGTSHAFDLYRFGTNGQAFVLRPSVQSIEAGTFNQSLWLFDHFTTHTPPLAN